jgi:antitoxin ParD1/3/4
MPMVKKSISITDRQADWLKSQITSGHYGNESEVIRDLIRRRQAPSESEQGQEDIESIRAALIKGEESGIEYRSLEDIWAEARKRRQVS